MLQGTLDNFALDEILGLLSGTAKTGRLDIAGDRGLGSLLIKDGAIVGAEANSAESDSTEDVMFELLRFTSGEFGFKPAVVEAADNGEDMQQILKVAEARLKDWKSIEAVVPSLKHIITPASDLPQETVTINRSEWAVFNVIAAGCPVSKVCDELELGEVEGSRQIKKLAERSLVLIGDPADISPSKSASVASSSDDLPFAADDDDDDSIETTVFEEADSGNQDGDEFEMGVPPSLSGISEDEADDDDEDGESEGAGVLNRYLGNS